MLRQWRPLVDGWASYLVPTTVDIQPREQVADEELLLDYRLSPGLSSRPGWYFPVNPEEEERRWA